MKGFPTGSILAAVGIITATALVTRKLIQGMDGMASSDAVQQREAFMGRCLLE